MSDLLRAHLRAWLGDWPDSGPGTPVEADSPAQLVVVGAAARDRPGWDGRFHPALGVTDPAGRGVLSVSPAHAAAVAELLARADGLGPDRLLAERLPALIGFPDRGWYGAVLRWSVKPAALPDAGEWEPADADGLPDWLRPFGGEVLVARDSDGAYLAGVGLKRHDRTGIELSVGTEPAARGRGLAQHLVAQAARAVIASGAVATYIHDPLNVASAHVAEAAGFPDRGWQIHAIM